MVNSGYRISYCSICKSCWLLCAVSLAPAAYVELSGFSHVQHGFVNIVSNLSMDPSLFQQMRLPVPLQKQCCVPGLWEKQWRPKLADPITRSPNCTICSHRSIKQPQCLSDSSVLASEELKPINGLFPGASLCCSRRISQFSSVLHSAALFIAIFSSHNIREPRAFAVLFLYIRTLKNSGMF